MNRSRVVLTAVAFALWIGGAAVALPQMPIRIDNNDLPTPEHIEATPPAKRLRELVAVINRGDDEVMREFVAGFAPTPACIAAATAKST